jgi:hypothetical protein
MSHLFSRVSVFDVVQHREAALKAAVNKLDAESLEAVVLPTNLDSQGLVF